jgi:hypothetical protein
VSVAQSVSTYAIRGSDLELRPGHLNVSWGPGGAQEGPREIPEWRQGELPRAIRRTSGEDQEYSRESPDAAPGGGDKGGAREPQGTRERPRREGLAQSGARECPRGTQGGFQGGLEGSMGTPGSPQEIQGLPRGAQGAPKGPGTPQGGAQGVQGVGAGKTQGGPRENPGVPHRDPREGPGEAQEASRGSPGGLRGFWVSTVGAQGEGLVVFQRNFDTISGGCLPTTLCFDTICWAPKHRHSVSIFFLGSRNVDTLCRYLFFWVLERRHSVSIPFFLGPETSTLFYYTFPSGFCTFDFCNVQK